MLRTGGLPCLIRNHQMSLHFYSLLPLNAAADQLPTTQIMTMRKGEKSNQQPNSTLSWAECHAKGWEKVP